MVEERPSAHDGKVGEVFSGLAGENFRRLLARAGLTRENTYLTTLVKCACNYEKEHREACKGWLWEEVKHYRPRVVLCLGTAVAAFLLKKVVKVGHVERLPWATVAVWASRHWLWQQGKQVQEKTVEFLKGLRHVDMAEEADLRQADTDARPCSTSPT